MAPLIAGVPILLDRRCLRSFASCGSSLKRSQRYLVASLTSVSGCRLGEEILNAVEIVAMVCRRVVHMVTSAAVCSPSIQVLEDSCIMTSDTRRRAKWKRAAVIIVTATSSAQAVDVTIALVADRIILSRGRESRAIIMPSG